MCIFKVLGLVCEKLKLLGVISETFDIVKTIITVVHLTGYILVKVVSSAD